MKIVKFEDGTYAIRRLSLLSGWEYLGRDADGRWYWRQFSYMKNSNSVISTLLAAESRLKAYKAPQPKDDYGTPVRKKSKIPPLGVYVPKCKCSCH